MYGAWPKLAKKLLLSMECSNDCFIFKKLYKTDFVIYYYIGINGAVSFHYSFPAKFLTNVEMCHSVAYKGKTVY